MRRFAICCAVCLMAFGALAQNAAPKKPRPLTDRPWVYSRAQLKYGLDRNYLRRWLDRPLFHDRSLRDAPIECAMRYGSFERIARIVTTYEIDGLAFFPETSGRSCAFDYADLAGVEGFHLHPEFIANTNIEAKDDVVEAALACDSVKRHNGKVIVTAYGADRLSIADWQGVLTELRDRRGDTFAFVPNFNYPAGQGWAHWMGRFHDGGVSEADKESIRAYFRQWLDVCDGIYFVSLGGLRRGDRTFDAEFYRDFVVPIYQSVLAEEKYKDKYFGLGAKVGYFQPGTGSTLDEDGTRTLRESFEAAMAGDPDIINLPEWDEFNENTCVRPTVYNSLSSQRILKHTMRQLKGLDPAPNDGDDRSVPNLIVSYRKILALGRQLEIELLNVPDSTEAARYTVTLSLKTPDGAVARRFDPVTFQANQLREHRLTAPSEELADYIALVPSLEIEKAGAPKTTFSDGLHHIQLRATWNWDWKWVKQPLRDVLRPSAATFAWQGDGAEPGEEIVAGSIACDEDIASVEVVENGLEVYAVDPQNLFEKDNPDSALFKIEYRGPRRKRLAGTMAVAGGEPTKWVQGCYQLHMEGIQVDTGTTITIDSNVDWYVRAAFLVIPKSEMQNASLNLNFNLASLSLPLKDVYERGIFSRTYEDGMTLTVERFDRLPDHPVHVDRRQVGFTARVRPWMPTSVLNLRVVTKSGKIYRSKPLTLPGVLDGQKVPIAVFSDVAGKAVKVHVAPARVPDVRYRFDDRWGSIFMADAGRSFWGHLGGAADISAGRDGGDGGTRGTAFIQGKRNFPDDAHDFAPDWTMHDGARTLQFNGYGNHIILPNETLPLRAGFHLSFEIKPTKRKSQILYAHHAYYIGSLVVKLDENNRLVGSYTAVDRDDSGEWYSRTFTLDPGMTLATNEWSKVEVVRDGENIRFIVNGQSSAPLDAPGMGFYLGVSVFGGFGKPGESISYVGEAGWFEGYLKSLEIRHSPFGPRKAGAM